MAIETLNLSLTLDEVNLILESIGQKPFVKVSNLIKKIQEQATGQLQEETRDVDTEESISEQVGE